MEIDFYIQTQAFVYSLLLGVLLGAVYGIFKFLRIAFLSSKTSVVIADIVFMLIVSFALFFYSLATLFGYVRIYVVFGALCGFLFYRFTLGKLICRIYSPLINAINMASQKIKTIFKKITKKLLKNSNNLLYNMGKKISEYRNKRKGLSVRKKVKASNDKRKEEKTAD